MAIEKINNHSDQAVARLNDKLKGKPNVEALLRSKACARADVIDVENPDDFILCINGYQFLYESIVNDTAATISSELVDLVNAVTDQPLIEVFESFPVNQEWYGVGKLGEWFEPPAPPASIIDIGGFIVQDTDPFECFQGIRTNLSAGVKVVGGSPLFIHPTSVLGYPGITENIQRMQVEIKIPTTFPGSSLKGTSGIFFPAVFSMFILPDYLALIGSLMYLPDGFGGYKFALVAFIVGQTPTANIIIDSIPEAYFINGDWHKITIDWKQDGTTIEGDIDDGTYNNTIAGITGGAFASNPSGFTFCVAASTIPVTITDIPNIYYDNLFIGNKGGELPFEVSALKFSETDDYLYVKSTSGVTGEEVTIATSPNMDWKRLGIIDQIQELEDTAFDLLLLRSLNTAEGLQLDKLGAIVGESRDGLSDDDYRLFIGVRISRNLSQGQPETLIQVLSALTGSSIVKLSEFYPAAVQLDFDGTVTGNPENLLAALEDIAAGGVRLILNEVNPNNRGFKYSSTGSPVTGSDKGYGSTVISNVGGFYAGLIGEE